MLLIISVLTDKGLIVPLQNAFALQPNQGNVHLSYPDPYHDPYDHN